jgi:hypothetical protein
VLSFGQEVVGHGQTLLQVHHRPTLGADQLILSPGTLAEGAAAGRRGGPPGTGDAITRTDGVTARTLLGGTPG